MRFARLGPVGQEIPVILADAEMYDLRSITEDIDGAFFASGGVARAVDAWNQGELPQVLHGQAPRVGAPIARPHAVFCVGMNYAAHAAESGAAPPEHLVVFLKPGNTVVGPYDDVAIPPGSTKTDWEVELGLVIGKRTSYLRSPSQSRAQIAGFVLVNDLSERTWQIEESGGQWSKGKGAPGFCPIGPWLVTPDEINADNVALSSFVNGQLRQDSRTADLIVPIDDIVYQLSQRFVLEPGDLILTGTPDGVALSGRFPYLQEGDVVELRIDGLGRQEQRMVRAESAETKEALQ